MCLPLVSSRINILFKVIEIVLVTRVSDTNRQKIILIATFIAISIFMTLKNINSYIEQGQYNDSIGIFNFPYVTIFNKEDIYTFRSSDFYYLIE